MPAGLVCCSPGLIQLAKKTLCSGADEIQLEGLQEMSEERVAVMVEYALVF